MDKALLEGVWTALLTPFDVNGEIDFQAVGKLVDYVIDSGVSGLVVSGTTGEFCECSGEERAALAQLVSQVNVGRVPLIVGVTGGSYGETLQNIAEAERAGADALLVLPPIYWKLNEPGLFSYFKSLADATRLPILLYNYPQLVGSPLPVSLVRLIARDIPSVIGIKMSVRDIDKITEVITNARRERPDFAVFTGFEDLLPATIWAGGNGCISGLSNIWAGDVVECYRALRSDSINVGMVFERIVRYCGAYGLTSPSILGLKAVGQLLGRPIGVTARVFSDVDSRGAIELASAWIAAELSNK